MNDEWTTPLTVEQIYGDWDVEWDEAMALTDQSLDPRPKTSMFDTLAARVVAETWSWIWVAGMQPMALRSSRGSDAVSSSSIPYNSTLTTARTPLPATTMAISSTCAGERSIRSP